LGRPVLDRSAVGQNSSDYQQITDNRCYFFLLDKDESCPTADLSNTGHPNGPAYSTGELLNTLLIFSYTAVTCTQQNSNQRFNDSTIYRRIVHSF